MQCRTDRKAKGAVGRLTQGCVAEAMVGPRVICTGYDEVECDQLSHVGVQGLWVDGGCARPTGRYPISLKARPNHTGHLERGLGGSGQLIDTLQQQTAQISRHITRL